MEGRQNVRIAAVTFATNDPEALAGFYQRAFNLPAVKKEDKDHWGVSLGGFYLGFDRIKEKAKETPSGAVIWFLVDDVEAAFTHLISIGARVRSNVTKDKRPGEALAVLFDPDGNMIGLMGPSVPGAQI